MLLLTRRWWLVVGLAHLSNACFVAPHRRCSLSCSTSSRINTIVSNGTARFLGPIRWLYNRETCIRYTQHFVEFGWLADEQNFQMAFWVLVIHCYCCLSLYRGILWPPHVNKQTASNARTNSKTIQICN